MDDWLEQFASALGVEPLSREETGAVLKLARDVAHGVERKFAPLSTYLLGLAVGGRAATAGERSAAFREALAGAHPTIPRPPEDVGATADPRER
jgi:hypothetical protein